MPDTQRFILTGHVVVDAGCLWLEVAGGGRWDLGFAPLHAYVGRRVLLSGRRSGFDGLEVAWICCDGEGLRFFPASFSERMLGALVVVATVLMIVGGVLAFAGGV